MKKIVICTDTLYQEEIFISKKLKKVVDVKNKEIHVLDYRNSRIWRISTYEMLNFVRGALLKVTTYEKANVDEYISYTKYHYRYSIDEHNVTTSNYESFNDSLRYESQVKVPFTYTL